MPPAPNAQHVQDMEAYAERGLSQASSQDVRNDGTVNNGARPASSLISDAGTGSVASTSIGGNPFHRRFHKASPMLSYLRLFLPNPQITRSVADPGSRQPEPCQHWLALRRSHRTCQATATRRAS